MIRMPHVRSYISMSAKLGFIDSQFYRFLTLCSHNKLTIFQMVSLILFLKVKSCYVEIILSRIRASLVKE
jgi:hypothetical protein